jgi:hypothetical protein
MYFNAANGGLMDSLDNEHKKISKKFNKYLVITLNEYDYEKENNGYLIRCVKKISSYFI